MMFRLVVGTLPTRTDNECRVNTFRRVKWPIVDNFGILLIRVPFFPVNEQRHVGKFDLNGIMMPLIVAYLA